MQLAGFVVFISTFVARIPLAEFIMDSSKPDESRLFEAAIRILESCYADRFATVGIAGPSAGNIIERMSLMKIVYPTMLIDGTSRSVPHGFLYDYNIYKLQAFVVMVNDSKTLAKTLEEIKSLRWWNHMAHYFLIDSTKVEDGCSNAYEILWEAWKVNLLNSKFMCLHRTRGELIYTFNPYASEAPSSWHQENTYKGTNDHVWTLFAREYYKNESRCDGLEFDKTMDLNGYEIRAAAEGMDRWWSADPTENVRINFRVLNITAQLLMDSLNATWKLSVYPFVSGNENNDVEEVTRGISDICLNFAKLDSSVIGRSTYPVLRVELGVVTQYQGYRSQLDKLISVLDKSTRFCVLGVMTITLLFFKCCLSKPLIQSFLNLVLLVSNAGIRRLPRKSAPRIYLAGLFVFVVTVQGIYSGQLASLLTKKVRQPSVDSWEDLVRSDYTIHGHEYWLRFFDSSAFEGRLVEVNVDPWMRAFQNRRAAGASTKFSLISMAAKHNLHLSRESMGSFYTVYPIRKDWPLTDRVNTIYERLAASGIQNLLNARQIQREMNVLESYEFQDQETELKVLALEHLDFAFMILAIGLGCATVTFIVEVSAFRVIATLRIVERVSRLKNAICRIFHRYWRHVRLFFDL